LLNKGSESHEKLSEWSNKIEELDVLIDLKTERWMEFEEKMGS